jgi:hypothetical protein
MSRPTATPRHDTALRVGVALVLVGTAASVITLLPLALGGDAFPVVVYLLCFLAPLGLAVVLIALFRRARSRSAQIRLAREGHVE